jgi:hypothetical protein
MKVPNILSGASDLISRAKRTDGDAAAAAGATTAGAGSAAPPSAASSMREIVSRYDMTDITPNDFSGMIQQLYAKGAISSKDMQDLSSIRADLESAGVGADQSVNLQEFYQQRLAKAKADAPQSSDPAAAQANIQAIAARMTWVQKFAAVGHEENAAGVNAVA